MGVKKGRGVTRARICQGGDRGEGGVTRGESIRAGMGVKWGRVEWGGGSGEYLNCDISKKGRRGKY